VRQRAIRTVLWLAFAASLAGNFTLAGLLYRAFGDVQFSRVFPFGYVPNGDLPLGGQAQDTRPILAFYGDSRIADWRAPPVLQGYRLVNLAHGGQTSGQLLAQLRMQPPVTSELSVLGVGINDLHPIGSLPRLRADILRQLRSNYAEVLDALQARSRRVVVMTVIPPGPVPFQRRPLWDGTTRSEVRAFNQFVQDIAAARGMPLLDAERLLGDGTGNLRAEYVDPSFFLHVNSAAYAILERELSSILGESGLPANSGVRGPDSAEAAARPELRPERP